jgi:hypothetical protein
VKTEITTEKYREIKIKEAVRDKCGKTVINVATRAGTRYW